MKLKAPDIAFSKVIREASDWTCQRCGKYYPEGSRQGLHCSHHVTRGRHSTRYHPGNAASHCYGCHSFLSGQPQEHKAWIETHMGVEAFEKIVQLSQKVTRFSDKDRKEVAKEYREELKRIQDLRNQGETGFIEPKCSVTVQMKLASC